MSCKATSKVLAQVHALIQVCQLFGISIEHQCGLSLMKERCTDATLARLAPARMRHVRVDVRVKPILLGSGLAPRRPRLLLGKADFHDRLDAFESMLPRHDESQRCPVLVGQYPPIEPDHHE